MKKLLLLFTLISLISCTMDDNKSSSTDTTIYGRWYFEETTSCGKNSIELQENSIIIEYHYDSNCNIGTYFDVYTFQNNILTINGVQEIVTELTSNKLTLYNKKTNTYTYYTKY